MKTLKSALHQNMDYYFRENSKALAEMLQRRDTTAYWKKWSRTVESAFEYTICEAKPHYDGGYRAFKGRGTVDIQPAKPKNRAK